MMFRTRTGCRGLDDPASPAAPRDVPVVLGASRSAGLRHELCRTFPPPPRCGTPRGWRWQEILSRAWLRDTKGKSAVSQSGGRHSADCIRFSGLLFLPCNARAALIPLDAPFPRNPADAAQTAQRRGRRIPAPKATRRPFSRPSPSSARPPSRAESSAPPGIGDLRAGRQELRRRTGLAVTRAGGTARR